MLLDPWNRTARFAVIGLALMLLGIGACTTETTTQIEAGQQGRIALKWNDQTAAATDKSTAFDAQRAITDFIAGYPGVEGLNVDVSEMMDETGAVTTDLGLMIWGDGLDAAALRTALVAEFPDLAAADISFEPLTTTITESLFDRLGRQVFHFETDGASDEEIRAQILQQLAEQGFTGDAQVEVTTEDGQQEIRIMLEEEVTK